MFDFFFPLPRRTPRVEAAVWDTDNGVHREFYTFRALLAHLWGQLKRLSPESIRLTSLSLGDGAGYFGYLFAVAYDAQSNQTFTTSWSFSHTCTGSDRFLLAGYHGDGPSSSLNLQYNGVTFTNDPGITSDASLGFFGVFSLINPASGSNTCSWTHDSAWSGTTKRNFAVSFSGSNQTTPIGAQTTVNHSADDEHTVTTSITTTYANALVVDFFATNSSGDPWTKGASQTTAFISDTGGVSGAASTYRVATTPGSYDMTWSWVSNHRYFHVVLEVRAPGEATGGGLLSFLSF